MLPVIVPLAAEAVEGVTNIDPTIAKNAITDAVKRLRALAAIMDPFYIEGYKDQPDDILLKFN